MQNAFLSESAPTVPILGVATHLAQRPLSMPLPGDFRYAFGGLSATIRARVKVIQNYEPPRRFFTLPSGELTSHTDYCTSKSIGVSHFGSDTSCVAKIAPDRLCCVVEY